MNGNVKSVGRLLWYDDQSTTVTMDQRLKVARLLANMESPPIIASLATPLHPSNILEIVAYSNVPTGTQATTTGRQL